MNTALPLTSNHSNGVGLPGMSISDPPTQAEVENVCIKVDELINALRRQAIAGGDGTVRMGRAYRARVPAPVFRADEGDVSDAVIPIRTAVDSLPKALIIRVP